MNLKSLLHPLMQHYFLQKAAKVYCFALLLLQRFKKNTYSPLEKNMKHWCTKHKRNVYNYSSIYKKCFVIIMQYINFNTTNISILANRKRKNQKIMINSATSYLQLAYCIELSLCIEQGIILSFCLYQLNGSLKLIAG